jgi:hypothetical protein
MSKKQATVAAIILEYLPMATPDVATEVSARILKALDEKPTETNNRRLPGGSHPDN